MNGEMPDDPFSLMRGEEDEDGRQSSPIPVESVTTQTAEMQSTRGSSMM